MTLEEAIKILDPETSREALDKYEYGGRPAILEAVNEACRVACAALRAQLEDGSNTPLKTTWETPETCPYCMEHLSREWSFCPECGRPTDWSENEPLTLEELREMDGEPVWADAIDGGASRWAFVDTGCGVIRYFTTRRGVACEVIGRDFKTYSKTWLAYRRKPEGGAT